MKSLLRLMEQQSNFIKSILPFFTREKIMQEKFSIYIFSVWPWEQNKKKLVEMDFHKRKFFYQTLWPSLREKISLNDNKSHGTLLSEKLRMAVIILSFSMNPEIQLLFIFISFCTVVYPIMCNQIAIVRSCKIFACEIVRFFCNWTILELLLFTPALQNILPNFLFNMEFIPSSSSE